MFSNSGDTLLCVCMRDVLYLSGCWIISAFEIHSRFHSPVMTVFAHDVVKKRGRELVLLPQECRDKLNDTQTIYI